MKVTLEQKKKAVEPEEKKVIESDLHAAITGKNDAPATAGDAMQNMADAADEFFGTCKEMGLLKDEPAKEKKLEHRVTGIMVEIGDFHYYPHSDCMDWTPAGHTETVSLKMDEWLQVMSDMPEAFRELGAIS